MFVVLTVCLVLGHTGRPHGAALVFSKVRFRDRLAVRIRRLESPLNFRAAELLPSFAQSRITDSNAGTGNMFSPGVATGRG